MKSMVKVLGIALVALMVSCDNNDENSTNASMSKSDMTNNAKLDEISDDVSNIADDQFIEQSNSGRMTGDVLKYLPDCAKVETVVEGNVWTRTIDFGTEGCALKNGNVLKGKIIISGSTDFSQLMKVVTCTLENFYHNNAMVTGTKTFTWELKATENLQTTHPVCTMEEDLTVTKLSNVALKITGSRVREMTEGFDTPKVWTDNVFMITGNRVVASPKTTVTAEITSALILRMNCNNIVSGVITFVKNGKTAVLDYGDGICDNKATITIDGKVDDILLGK